MITLKIDRPAGWNPYGDNDGFWWSKFFYSNGGWAKVPSILATSYNASLVFDETESTVIAIAFDDPLNAYRFIFEWP